MKKKSSAISPHKKMAMGDLKAGNKLPTKMKAGGKVPMPKKDGKKCK